MKALLFLRPARNFYGHLSKKKFFLALFFLLCLSVDGLTPYAHGQPKAKDLTQMNLEDLMKVEIASVSGASRYEQQVTQAPSLVTIITRDGIKKYGYRTLADILQSVRSFFVT